MQSLPGFRDFLPDDCALRNCDFRPLARGLLAVTAFSNGRARLLSRLTYTKKKAVPEIVAQLFNFTDKGDREVAMRPELTPIARPGRGGA